MIGFFVFTFPLLEIWALFHFGAMIGFANTVFALIAGAVLGFGLIRNQGAFLLQNMQATLAKGQLPTNQIFHSLLIFVGGLLFIVPGFISDVLALILVLPGSRHLVAYAIRKRIAKKLKDGSFRMAGFGNFSGGFGRFGGFSGGFGANPDARPRSSAGEEFRDVSPRELHGTAEVIDVTRIKPSGRDHKE